MIVFLSGKDEIHRVPYPVFFSNSIRVNFLFLFAVEPPELLPAPPRHGPYLQREAESFVNPEVSLTMLHEYQNRFANSVLNRSNISL